MARLLQTSRYVFNLIPLLSCFNVGWTRTDIKVQGIYVTGEQAKGLGKSVGFGVRLEDPILVTADGGVPMTGSRAKSPYEP